jgi:HEAT repeat protein
VPEGLIKLLEHPPEDIGAGQIIDQFRGAQQDLPHIVDVIVPFTRHETFSGRWGAYYTLSWLLGRHAELRDRIAPVLATGLADPDERVREQVVRAVGYHHIEEGADALRPLLSDAKLDVRLFAARAIWQTAGDRAPLLTAATATLVADYQDYEAKRFAAQAIDEVPLLPDDVIAALKTCAAYNKRPPFDNHGETTRYQLAMLAQKILKAQTPGDSVGGASAGAEPAFDSRAPR